MVIIVNFTNGKAIVFKNSQDLLNSQDIPPYTKLEYLEREITKLREEAEHIKWLKDIPLKEREQLIHQDFDKLLKLNASTEAIARGYVVRFHNDIKQNVESTYPEDESISDRYGF